ncbi:MAG: hypothetical protein ABI885_09595, partial [Gammaproteobacteria bacterium]
MKTLALNPLVAATAVAVALASFVTANVFAADTASAKAPARLADGHPDFNGSWENGSGYDFIKPQKSEDGSICISGCAPAAGGNSPGAAPPG